MKLIDEFVCQMQINANHNKAIDLQRFFKTAPGQYGEGDRFIGILVPIQRKIAKQFKELTLEEIKELLYKDIHEYRLTAVFILVNKFQNCHENEKEAIVNFYIKHAKRINNWDLVDSSAHKILGPFLIDKDKTILYDFAISENLWEQRISIMSTFHFIMNNKFEDTIEISKILISNKHDLIHKAVGWMLREIGKRNIEVEIEFLRQFYKIMPRTMLRYAIEKFPEAERQLYLKGLI